MRLPDFLVIGAQKSGTTSLFILMSKHPQLFLPPHKEVQFFSSSSLYAKGLSWYAEEFFEHCPGGSLAGEVSPQYMYSTRVAARVHGDLPRAKIIAILREPIDRAYSHYLMTCRRKQECRPLAEAFAAAASVGEIDEDAPESARYFQFSDYEKVLSEYLRLYGRENVLILFQEDLDHTPRKVMKHVSVFLGIRDETPENVNVRIHQSGEVRFKVVDRLLSEDSFSRRFLRAFIPRKFRRAIVFWAEILNIRPTNLGGVPEELRERYADFASRQRSFLERECGITPPWPSAGGAGSA